MYECVYICKCGFVSVVFVCMGVYVYMSAGVLMCGVCMYACVCKCICVCVSMNVCAHVISHLDLSFSHFPTQNPPLPFTDV